MTRRPAVARHAVACRVRLSVLLLGLAACAGPAPTEPAARAPLGRAAALAARLGAAPSVGAVERLSGSDVDVECMYGGTEPCGAPRIPEIEQREGEDVQAPVQGTPARPDAP